MPVEWSPDPKSARTCVPSVFPELPYSGKNISCWLSRVQSAFSVYFLSVFPEDIHDIWWMGSSEFNEKKKKKKSWERLGNILWDLFKVGRFLTCRRPECKRIASDLLISSGFRVIWRQCSLGACWNWWKAKVSPARKAGNLELDLGKSSPASQAAAFSDSLPQQRQI